MEMESRLRSLERTVKAQSIVLLIAAFWIAGSYGLSRLREIGSEVTLRRDGNIVSVRSLDDGPFLITHLTVNGADADSERDQLTAALPEPTACIDSAGLSFGDISKLDWRNTRGEPANPPAPHVRLSALMLRPEFIETRDISP